MSEKIPVISSCHHNLSRTWLLRLLRFEAGSLWSFLVSQHPQKNSWGHRQVLDFLMIPHRSLGTQAIGWRWFLDSSCNQFTNKNNRCVSRRFQPLCTMLYTPSQKDLTIEVPGRQVRTQPVLNIMFVHLLDTKSSKWHGLPSTHRAPRPAWSSQARPTQLPPWTSTRLYCASTLRSKPAKDSKGVKWSWRNQRTWYREFPVLYRIFERKNGRVHKSRYHLFRGFSGPARTLILMMSNQ